MRMGYIRKPAMEEYAAQISATPNVGRKERMKHTTELNQTNSRMITGIRKGSREICPEKIALDTKQSR